MVPSRKVEHVTLRVSEGKGVMLGGLARVEMVEGRPFFLTFFLAPGVSIHASGHHGHAADEFVRKHLGDAEKTVSAKPKKGASKSAASSSSSSSASMLLSPPFEASRLDAIGELVPHNILAEGSGWNEAGCDVVLSGLGWFSVTGVGSCKLESSRRWALWSFKGPLCPSKHARAWARARAGASSRGAAAAASAAKKRNSNSNSNNNNNNNNRNRNGNGNGNGNGNNGNRNRGGPAASSRGGGGRFAKDEGNEGERERRKKKKKKKKKENKNAPKESSLVKIEIT